MDDSCSSIEYVDDFTEYDESQCNDDDTYEYYYDDGEISEEEFYPSFPEMDSVIREAAVGFKVIDYHDEEVLCLGHIDEVQVEHNIHNDLLSTRSLKLMKKLKEGTATTDIPLQLIDMLEHKRNSNYVIDGINQKKEWRNLFRSPSSTSFKRCTLCDKKKSAPLHLPRLMHEDTMKRHSTINCCQISTASSTNFCPISSEMRQKYIRNLRQEASLNTFTINSPSPIEGKCCHSKRSSKTSMSVQCEDSFTNLTTRNSKSVQYNPVGGIPSAGDVILYSNASRWNNNRTCEKAKKTTKSTPSNTTFATVEEQDSFEDICVELKFEHAKQPCSESCVKNGNKTGSISSSKSVVYVTSKPTRRNSSTFNNYLVHRMSIPPSEASNLPNQQSNNVSNQQNQDNSSNVVILYKTPSNSKTTNCNVYPPITEIFKSKNTSYRFDSDTSSTSSGISQQQPVRRRLPPQKTVDRMHQDVKPLSRCPNRTFGLNALDEQCKNLPRRQLPRSRVRVMSPGVRNQRENRDAEDDFDLTNQDFVEKFLKRNRNN